MENLRQAKVEVVVEVVEDRLVAFSVATSEVDVVLLGGHVVRMVR